MASIRVAYFIDHLKVSGPQRHLVQVLRRIDRARFSPQIWTLRGEGELIAEIKRLEIPIYSVGLGERLLDLRSLPVLLRVVRSLQQDRVHIVHCYLAVANVVGTLAAILAQVPVRIVSKRSLDHYNRKVEVWAHWSINRVADRVTAVAEAVKEFVIQEEGCPPNKIVVIPNGVNNDISFGDVQGTRQAALQLDSGGKIIGTLGRLEWKKGHEYLISAAAEVLRQEPETTFVLVGEGALRHKLENQARELGILPRVKFLGQRLDSHDMLSLFDVFVLPSVMEGMSNALLEALSQAKPAIVTDVGGNAEVVTHEKTGLVVPPRQPLALAEAIVRLLREEKFAQGLGQAGRRSVSARYSSQHMLHALESLYEELLQEKKVQV